MLMLLFPCLAAACPTGTNKCGLVCIDPSSQCCKVTPANGLRCTSPYTCPNNGGVCGEQGPDGVGHPGACHGIVRFRQV